MKGKKEWLNKTAYLLHWKKLGKSLTPCCHLPYSCFCLKHPEPLDQVPDFLLLYFYLLSFLVLLLTEVLKLNAFVNLKIQLHAFVWNSKITIFSTKKSSVILAEIRLTLRVFFKFYLQLVYVHISYRCFASLSIAWHLG